MDATVRMIGNESGRDAEGRHNSHIRKRTKLTMASSPMAQMSNTTSAIGLSFAGSSPLRDILTHQ